MTKRTSKELAETAALYTKEKDFDRGAEHVAVSGPTEAISIRFPEQQLVVLREFARRQGIGYQTLIKRWLDDRIREEAILMESSPEGTVHAIRKDVERVQRRLRELEEHERQRHVGGR